MSAKRFLGLVTVSAWLAAGCSSAKKIEVGGTCVLNSDCNSPLLCTDGKCHDACHASIDCPPGENCVKTASSTVCQLPAEASCSRTPCSGAYVCASDLQCRTPCQSAADCADAQVCVTNVCADPIELVLSTGQLPQKGPSPAADGGTDARATATGGTGGGGGLGGTGGSSGGAADAATTGSGGANDAAGALGGAGDGATAGSAGGKNGGIGPGGAGGFSGGVAGAGGTGGASGGAGNTGGTSGGAGGTATPDARSSDLRPADAAPPSDAKTTTPDSATTTSLDGGASTVLTGCGKVTTQRYFCDDFESGLDNWHYATEGWGLTTTTFQSASHSVTDSPSGNYSAGAKSEITMVNSMDLTGAMTPIVTFWHKLAIPNGNAYVDVSKDAGTTWTAVKTFTSGDNTSVWSVQQLSVASYVGTKIKLRFRLETGSTVGDGWYLDDIEVRETDLPSTGVPAPVKPASPQRYFFDDFESGLDQWHHATEGWDLVTTTSQSATHSVTDSPNGNYPVGAKSEITMVNSANLTGAVSPVVTFWHKLDLYYDSTYVDASSDGGNTWTVVTKFDYSKNNTSAWSFQQLSLAPYAGKKVKLRFRLVSSNTSTGDGWHIDDVEIREAELPPGSVPDPGSQNISAEPTGCENGPTTGRYFCEDFEAGLSNWLVAAEGWNTVVATSQSPSHSVTDSPNGNYPVGAKSDITMASSVDLTSAASPILTFWHKLDVYYNDYTYIDASSDGGTTWTVVARFDIYSSTSVWSFQQLSLASYAGNKVKLRFRLVDNADSTTRDGWYLDDIKIRENEFVPTSRDIALCTTQAAGGACNSADLCGKTCGPDVLGSKSLTCTASKFVEGACTFPASLDYSCYKVGAAQACAAGTKAGQACTATACQACGATTGTGYLDASGAAKQGFCVCSKGIWSCGTTAEWPCYPQTAGATVPASCD